MSLANAPARSAGIGDNSAAAALADCEERLAAFLKGWDAWAPLTLDDESAPKARDFYDGAGKLLREIDEARRAAKIPHEQAARAVDAKFNPLKDKLDKIIAPMRAKLDAFAAVLRKREQEERARREKLARDAEEAAKAAALDALNAQSAGAQIEAESRADEAARTAQEAAAAVKDVAPARIASATGLAKNLGIRRRRTATLISVPLAVSHFKDAPELRECLEKLANAACRAAGVDKDIAIPGFEITMTEGV